MPPRRAEAAAAAMQRAQRMDRDNVTPMQALEDTVRHMADRLQVDPINNADENERDRAFYDRWINYVKHRYRSLFPQETSGEDMDEDAPTTDYDRMYNIAHGRFTGNLVEFVHNSTEITEYAHLITIDELKQLIDSIDEDDEYDELPELWRIWKKRANPDESNALVVASRDPVTVFKIALSYMQAVHRKRPIASKEAFSELFANYFRTRYHTVFRRYFDADSTTEADGHDADTAYGVGLARWGIGLVAFAHRVFHKPADRAMILALITNDELKALADAGVGKKGELMDLWKERASPEEIAAMPPPRPVLTLTEDQLMRGYTTAVAQLDEHAQYYRSNMYDPPGLRTIDSRMAHRIVQAITVAMQIRNNQVADESADAILSLAVNANNVWVYTGGLITGGNQKPHAAVAQFLYPQDVRTPTRDTPATHVFLVRAVPAMLAAFVRQFGHEPGAQALARLMPQVHDRIAVERAMLHRAPFARGPIADLVTQMLAPDAVSRDRPFRALMNQAQRERDAPHLTNEDRLDSIIRSIDAHTDPLFIRRQLEALRASIAASAASTETAKRRRVGEKSKQ